VHTLCKAIKQSKVGISIIVSLLNCNIAPMPTFVQNSNHKSWTNVDKDVIGKDDNGYACFSSLTKQ